MPIIASHVPFTSVDWLRSHGIAIAIIVVAAFLVSRLVGIASGRTRRRLEKLQRFTEQDRQRVATLSEVIRRALRAVIWTVAVMMLLGEVGVNLGPLIAGAGIIGLAIGFGAQSLVKDFFSGFFILLEDQFGVGDMITLVAEGGTVIGTVESLTMRVTQLRDLEGTLHYVPNGNILEIGNRTELWAKAILDVGVAYGEDVDRVIEVLESELAAAAEDEEIRELFVEPPQVQGVQELADSAVVIRSAIKVNAVDRWPLQRELLRRIKNRFDREGIEIPFPQRVVWMRRDENT
jgi:small conductance mechanosensitive channel